MEYEINMVIKVSKVNGTVVLLLRLKLWDKRYAFDYPHKKCDIRKHRICTFIKKGVNNS